MTLLHIDSKTDLPLWMVVVKPSGNPVISAPLTTDFVLEWFAKWNPDQRSEFGKLLVSMIVRPPGSNHVDSGMAH